MRKALLLVLLVGAASTVPGKPEQWEEFKRKHGKVYKDSAEEKRRMEAFAENSARVEQHMREYAEGKHSFTMALNKFADLTAQEIFGESASPKRGRRSYEYRGHHQYEPLGDPLPASVDWRAAGMVTSVKDQTQCCQCATAGWAFAAAAALESAYLQAGRGVQDFSEKQLIDCAAKTYYFGVDLAFERIRESGIAIESAYPCTAPRFCSSDWQTQIADFGEVFTGAEGELEDAVAFVGPVAANIGAPLASFYQYSGGVYYEPNCRTDSLSHAVLIVGYGTENGRDYWLCKNSWGADWGEGGYIKMSRNANNQCRIASNAYFPLIEPWQEIGN